MKWNIHVDYNRVQWYTKRKPARTGYIKIKNSCIGYEIINDLYYF